MISSFHIEPILAGIYVLLLLIVASVLEWMARHSHRRSDQYDTGGFHFHRDRDLWECPIGITLIRAEVDHAQKIVRYRAPAHTCNNCAIKSRCTDSDHGREIAMPLDPWLASASVFFQQGMSFVLLILACFLTIIELLRHGHNHERWLLAMLFILVSYRLIRLATRLRERSQRMHSTAQ
jgi:hypothetical protein